MDPRIIDALPTKGLEFFIKSKTKAKNFAPRPILHFCPRDQDLALEDYITAFYRLDILPVTKPSIEKED